MLILAITAVFLSACNNNAQLEPPEIEKPSDMKTLTCCVYKSGDKYGIYHEEEIITEPIYDSFKRQKLGEEDIYILGRVDGTKPCIEYDEDGKPIGVSETERTLYDIFFYDGTRAVNKTADGYVTFKEGFLNISCGGDLFEYSFDANGKFIESGSFPAGKEPSGVDGYDIVTYYYGPDRLSKGAGIVDSEGNEIIPMIYSSVGIYFGDRIVANKVDGFGLSEIGRIYDLEGNIICEKYNRIEYFEFSNGEYLGVASTAGPMSQVATVIRDENGNEMPKGSRFIDKDGNEISPVFINNADFGKPYYSSDDTVTVTLSDGTETDLIIRDYIFYGGGEISSEFELVNDISYRENGKYGFHKDGVPVTEAVFDAIVPITKVTDDEVYVNTYELDEKDIEDLFVGIVYDGTRKSIDTIYWEGTKTFERENILYSIYQRGEDSLINETPFVNFSLNAPDSFGNSLDVLLLSGTNGGDKYDYIPTENGWKLYAKESGGVYNAYSEICYLTKYYWQGSTCYYGLEKPDGTVIIEPIYGRIDMLPYKFVLAYDGWSNQTMEDLICTYMYDFEGNVICDDYKYIKYEFVSQGKFVVIAVDSDYNWFFIDPTGKKLSESYGRIELVYDENTTGTTKAKAYTKGDGYYPDGEYTEISIKDYIIYNS